LKRQLAKGYIHESKSPQTSVEFFILKKDMKKRIVQDYQYEMKEQFKIIIHYH
jgi:hypothetical protein